ncbi:MAG: MBG domain-containing protein, partial [Cyclobacteriaceae bacterium]
MKHLLHHRINRFKEILQFTSQLLRAISQSKRKKVGLSLMLMLMMSFTSQAQAPTVNSFSPATGGTVEKNDPLVINFSESVRKDNGSAEIRIKTLASGKTFRTILVNDLIFLGSRVTIPDQDLAHNVTYYVEIDSDAIEDLSNINYAGISDDETWRFTAEDQIDPSLLSLSPINGGTDVDISPTLLATFDEPMAFAQLNASFQLREVADNSFAYSWTVNPPGGTISEYVTISGNQILFEVPISLDFNKEYKFQGHFVSDANGNETIAVWGTWEFTTRAAYTDTDVLSATIPGVVGDPVINNVNNTITATVEATTPSRLDLTFELSPGATNSFSSNPQFYQNGVAFPMTVRAEANNFESWTITLNWEGMAGNYTVGDNGTFETLTDGISQIAHAGMSGDVVLEVEDGYDVRKTVFLANPDPTYNITIRPQAGATQIDLYPESNFGSVFRLNSAISNMVIDGADPSTGNIVMNVNSDIAGVEGVNFFGSGVHDFTLKNLRFNILDATAISSNSGTSEISGIDIIGCEFVAVNTDASADIRGIFFQRNNLADINIIGNKFYNEGVNDPALFAAIAGLDYYDNVINNSISIRGNSTSGVGRGTNIYHNSINIYGTGTETSSSHYAIGFGTNIKNNNISIERTSGSGTSKEFVAFSSIQSGDSDNNVYIFDDGNSTIEYAPNASDQATMLSIVPTTTFVESTFTDGATANLLLSGASADELDLRSTPLAEVTDDINGTTRSPNLVTKGAFESPNRFTDLLTFSFPEETGAAVIDTDNGTVDIEVEVGTDLAALTPTITVFTGATISPLSGVERDFSSPVNYTVTAEDGQTAQQYTVTVTRVVNTETDITSFSIPEQSSPAVIDENAHTVTIAMDAFAGPQGSAATVNRLTPTITTSFGATISPESGQFQHFIDGIPKTYTVTAEDGITQEDWQVTVNYDLFSEGLYTVGTGGDFEYLTEAIGKIRRSGISGNVTLVMTENATTSQSEVFQTYDGNEDYTLTLTVDDGLSDAEISFGTLSFSTNDNIIVDGKSKLSIRSNRTPNNAALFTGGSNIEIRGVTFYGDGISLEGSNILIENCNFLVDDNTLTSVTAIESDATNVVIRNNNIHYGSVLDNVSTTLIQAIRLEHGGSAYNNFIHLNPTVAQSIYAFLYVDDAEIYHNTILIEGSSSNNEEIFGFREITRSFEEPIIVNNLLSIPRDPGLGGSKTALYFGTSTNTVSTAYENNNFYLAINSGSLTYVWDRGTVYDDSNFETLQQAVEGTTNSETVFTDAANNDLTLTGTSLTDADLRAVPVSGITDDYFGTTRSVHLSTKGAHETPNTLDELIAFSLPEQTGEATIDPDNHTVSIEVPFGTVVTGLMPTVGVSPGATVSPVSEQSTDFTNPATYTVTAEDGSTTQEYVVTVTFAPNSEAHITSWTMEGMIGNAVIDDVNNTVVLTLNGLAGFGSAGSVQTYKFNPIFELSFGASMSPLPGAFSSHAPGQVRTFTVTAEDGSTTEEWTVTSNYETISGGIYEIGTGGDFESIATAFRRLTDIGVDGDITLEILEDQMVSSAQLNEREDLLGHTLIIQPADGVTELLFSQSTSAQSLSMNWQKVIIDGKNVTKIENRSIGSVISLNNSNPDPDEFAIIKNVTIEGTSSSSIANTTIENCEFIMEDNLTTHLWAFSVGGQNGLIRNNDIYWGSIIDKPTSSLFGFTVLQGGEVYNNFIHLSPTSVASIYGIQYRSNVETNIHHNTILIEGTATGNENVWGIYDTGVSNEPVNLQNNLISISRNPGTSGSKTGYEFRTNSTAVPVHTYNSIYLEDNSGSLVYVNDKGTLYDNSNFTTLEGIVEGTTRSQPTFTDAANNDLTLSGASLGDGDLRGTPIAEITTDFFGTSRSTTSPSKGAHEVPNNQHDIVAFSIPEQTGAATIDAGNHTVSIEVLFSADEEALTPTIEVSPGAGISPQGGSPTNFSSPVSYTVTAESTDTQMWTVTVRKAPPSLETDFITFDIQGQTDDAVIDATNHTISYRVPFGTNLTTLVPEFDLSPGATSSPMSGASNDFSSPQTYTVTAEDVNETQDWTITVTEANVDPSDIALSPSNIDENLPAGTVVGDVTGTDPNGDDLSFSLVSGVGSTHNNLFEIDPLTDKLKSKFVFDYEAGVHTYFIRIRTEDGEGGSREEEFEITLNDVDDTAPALVSRIPDDNGGNANAELNANIVIEFDEDLVSNLNVSNQIRLGFNQGALVEQFIDNSRISINANTITIDPTEDLLPGTTYQVFVQAGSLKDALNNLITAFDWTFTTKKLDQTITFNEFDPATFGDPTISLSEFTDANLAIAYQSDDTDVASVTGNVLTIHGAGIAEITATQAGNNQYNAAEAVMQVITVAPQNVNISLAGLTELTYNGAAQGVTASALDLNNDPLALVIEYSLQGDDNFSETIPENATTYDVRANLDAAIVNYSATTATGTLTINTLAVTVTPDANQSKVYGQEDPDFTYTSIPALVNGDNFIGDLERAPGNDVGNYEITQGSLTAGDNYDISFSSADFEITQRGVAVTVDVNQSKVYGEDDPVSFTYTATPVLVNGDEFTGALTREAGDDVGSYLIEQGDLTAGDNYDITFNDANFIITQKAIAVTVDSGQEKVYGEDDPVELAFTTSPELIEGDEFTGALVREVGEDADNYAINQGSLSAGDNYSITFTGTDFIITPKSISVDATVGLTKVFGDDDPEFTFSVNPSLEDGDSFSGNLTRDPGENVGTYNINQGSLTAGDNYTILYDGSEFSITIRNVSITMDALTEVTYNGQPQMVSASALDVNNDPLDLLIEYSVQGQNSYSETAPTNAGSYDVRANLAGSITNYSADEVTGTLTIDRADPVIEITAITDKIQTSDPFDVVATVNSGQTLNYNVLSGPATNSGNTITLNGTTGTVTIEVSVIQTANYNAGSEQVSFEVTDKLPQTITFTEVLDKTFGDAAVTLEATADSGLTPVTFSVQSGPGSISNDNVLNFDGAGTIVVRASQAGDET